MTPPAMERAVRFSRGYESVFLLVVLATSLISILSCQAPAATREEQALLESSPEQDAGGDADAALPEEPAVVPDQSTDPDLKVAFIGDTGSQLAFRSVLGLVKAERADLVVLQGDLTYDGEHSSEWLSVIDAELDADGAGDAGDAGAGEPVKIPYFVAKGNHDREWPYMSQKLAERLSKWGIAVDHGAPQDLNYSIVYRGLRIVLLGDQETSPTRAEYIDARLRSDPHLFRVCSWHKNLRNTNVGAKYDEMPLSTYQACLAHGAIIAQAHSHTYSRSKTVVALDSPQVDEMCADPFALCLGPKRTFFFDSSLGGHDARPVNAAIAARPYWAAATTGVFGAFFVQFHTGGDPRKARAYFRTTDGATIDPPASSGRTDLEITRDP
jgi:hypothetical protein